MDRKIMAIVAAILVVAIAAAAYVALGTGNDNNTDSGNDDNGGNNDGKELAVEYKFNPQVRLAVFGNANGDDYLDDKDVQTIKDLISGKLTYDPVMNAYADTNADGIINEEDIVILEKILAGEKCTMKYWACSKSIASIDYPLSGKIGTHHMYAIDALIIIGQYDNIVATSNQTFQNSISTDGIRYPGMGDKIKNVGSPWEDCQAAVREGVNIWIETGYSTSRNYDTYKTVANAAGLNLQIIQLYVTTYDANATEIYGSILILGAMFQEQDKAHEYVDWVDNVIDYIDTESSKITEDWTFLTPMGTKSANDISLDTTYTNGNMMGDVYTISLTGLKSVNTVVDSGCPDISMEEIYRLNPDVIVIIMFQTSDKSVEQIQNDFNAYASIYKETDAYKNGNIYGVNYYNIASCAGASELVLLSSYIWPDLFSSELGWEYIQYYYDHFTMYDHADVKNMGNAIPFKMQTA